METNIIYNEDCLKGMGSGTTAIACLMEGRKYIGFETDAVYYGKCLERIAGVVKQ